MYILTIHGKENEGAYSVRDDGGDNILYLFEQHDDAMRFAMQLEDKDYPEMSVMEVEDEIMIKTCEIHDYKYAIITKHDVVIPPKEEEHDFI